MQENKNSRRINMALSANELRIGNFVNVLMYKCDGYEIYQISEIRKYAISDVNDLSFQYESVEPIPLTEEWLLKFGFEKCNTSRIITSYSKSISWSGGDYKTISVCPDLGNQYIYLRHGELNGSRDDDNLICIFNGDVNGALYVHGLQNLYFALNGKELTIKT